MSVNNYINANYINAFKNAFKHVPHHREGSMTIQHEFEFQLYDCVQPKWLNSGECLIIGFKDDSYIVIRSKNRNLSSDKLAKFNLELISKKCLEKDYKKVNRPNFGIFKKCRKGDKILCVAKGRYMGVSGGHIYDVEDIINDAGIERVHIKGTSGSATYEQKYFIVLRSEEKFSNAWGVSDEVRASPANTATNTGSIKRLKGNLCIELVDKIIESEDILERKTLEETPLEKRELYDTELIERQTIN